MDGLETAICIEGAAIDTGEDLSGQTLPLSNLGERSYEYMSKTVSGDDLDESEDIGKAAFDALKDNLERVMRIERAIVKPDTGDDLSEQTHRFNNLGKKYYEYALRTLLRDDPDESKDVDDLEESIRIERAAADATDHPRERALHLITIREKLDELSLKAGSPDSRCKDVRKELADALGHDLEWSIRIEHLGVNDTPENHPDRALNLHNLGVKLYELFLKTKKLTDLEEAIRIGQAAVDATPENSAARPVYLSSMGARFLCRYRRTGSIDDLEKSIGIAQATVDTTTEHPLRRATWLHNLGNRFHDLFLRTRSMDHLEKAVRFGQDAVDVAQDSLGPSVQAICLSSLGICLETRYHQTGSAADLDNAILNGKAAIDITSEDDPGRARRLRDLATIFLTRHRRTGSTDDLQEAFAHLTESLYDSWSPHFDCILSGMQAADIASRGGQYDQGAQYLTECLELLPFIVLRSHSHEDLQYILRQLSGLASLSASVFLRAGRSALKSLLALEKSRGIISSFVIESRFDVSILEERYPDLWCRYCYLREWIAASTLLSTASNNATIPQIPGGHYSLMTVARRVMSDELDTVKHIIRSQPEFERFQLPPTEAELHGMARYGPIVSFNVTPFSSHAFLITEKCVQALPLPKLILEDIQKQISRDMGGNLSRRDAKLVSVDGNSKAEGHLHASNQTESMRWIWDVAVKPVLETLGLLWQHKPPPILPCLWWVGGGLMALLPLHAAGEHQLGSTENTMSHVVSSYAPSLKALQFSQEKAWTPPKTEDTKIVVITMPKTLGHADLNVEDEVAAIQQHVGSTALVEVLETPTAATVLKRTTACSIVHFACHGASDVEQPSNSALLLGTGTVESLTIGDLQSLNHQLAQVAYLSACSTAEIGARSLIDESINLATTFQLAGFRHVIGTLWGAFDSAAVAVAAKFYEHLLKQDAGTVSPVARALHQAVLDLRAENSNSESISLWAPFIHIGP